jgi:hypothetical protein
MKPFSFFFHYNKPASLKRGKPTISVHYKGACHLVDNVKCFVTTEGRVKATSPKFVMAGKAYHVEVVKGVAVIG